MPDLGRAIEPLESLKSGRFPLSRALYLVHRAGVHRFPAPTRRAELRPSRRPTARLRVTRARLPSGANRIGRVGLDRRSGEELHRGDLRWDHRKEDPNLADSRRRHLDLIRQSRRAPPPRDDGPGLRAHGEEGAVLVLDDQEDGAGAFALQLVVEARVEGDDAPWNERRAVRRLQAHDRDAVWPHRLGG
jgi:hypothetical protein